MEELDYIWLEEPMHEQKMNLYQELCRTLTIPVMATEMLCHDMDLTAQWLIQGATDRLRARTPTHEHRPDPSTQAGPFRRAARRQRGTARAGRTLRARACPCRLLHRQHRLLRASRPGRPPAPAFRRGRMGPPQRPLIEDGHIAPPDGPGWGAVWDEKRVRSLTVATDER